jgi:hypothetical protein
MDCKYVRYSDDQVVFCKDEQSAKKLLYLAANFLARINLNLNPSKVDIFNSKEQFHQYWSFDIFQLLIEPYKKEKIEEAIRIYSDRTSKKIKFRTTSILRKITNTLSKSGMRVDISLRKIVEADITRDSHLLSSKGYDLRSIYKILDTKSKRDLIAQLQKLSKTYLFNQYHYSLLASKLRGLNKREIYTDIKVFK